MPDRIDTPAFERRRPDVGRADRGALAVVCGCMFSGKTTELLRRLDQFPPDGALAFKHVIDNRYRADAIVSHAGKATSAVVISAAAEIFGHLRGNTSVVAIDEAHFFDMELASAVQELIRGGIDVVVTCLDNDSWGRPFDIAGQLREIADEPMVMHATCARCAAAADHTQRLTPIVDYNMVGGPESYEPRCPKCWTAPPEPPPKSGGAG